MLKVGQYGATRQNSSYFKSIKIHPKDEHMKSHLDTVRHWFHEVWSKENTEAIFELFKPEGITGGLGESITEAQQFAVFQQALLNLISDVEITIDDHIERGDKIALICTLRAKKRQKEQQICLDLTTQPFFRLDSRVVN